MVETAGGQRVPVDVTGRRCGRRLFLMFALGVVVLDQVLKYLVQSRLQWGTSYPVIPGFLDLTLSTNRGGAWGVLGHASSLLTVIAALLVAGILLWGIARGPRSVWLSVAFGLLLGGALGNLLDRLRLGHVIDFINFSFWPTFNIADMGITSGAIMILLEALTGSRRLCTAPEAEPAPEGDEA